MSFERFLCFLLLNHHVWIVLAHIVLGGGRGVDADGETGDEHVSDSVLGGNDIILCVAHKVLHRIMSDYRSSKDMCVTGACHMHDLVVGPHIAHIGLVTITGGENKRRCQQTGR